MPSVEHWAERSAGRPVVEQPVVRERVAVMQRVEVELVAILLVLRVGRFLVE
jgi:hypothetical protein